MGSSAGGHLAVLSGVVDGVDPDERPTAVMGLGAQTDFTAPHIVRRLLVREPVFTYHFSVVVIGRILVRI